MSDPVYKVVEVVETSGQSVSNAIDSAITKASGTLRRLGWFEVVSQTSFMAAAVADFMMRISARWQAVIR